MSKHCQQSESMKALEQSLNDHMEICRLQRKAKRLKAENVRLKAEFERLRKATEWQPIETAPKDGTWVLLWWKETPTGAECFDEWSPEQAVGKWHYDCWMRCSEYCVGGTPTAWQPLPNPPPAKEGKQS